MFASFILQRTIFGKVEVLSGLVPAPRLHMVVEHPRKHGFCGCWARGRTPGSGRSNLPVLRYFVGVHRAPARLAATFIQTYRTDVWDVVECCCGSVRWQKWCRHVFYAASAEVFQTTVLAWHDMFGHAIEFDLAAYHMADVLEPVVWSYAEDLDLYLPKTTWLSLKPFHRVWGSSAWKGADGPARFNSNPVHYIRNHEAWVEQMSRNYNEFDSLQGLILAGWSRYDHLAILCELAPVAFPTLAMSMETILEGRPLNGNYPVSRDILQCTPSTTMGITYGCQFPGHKVYELINEFWQRRKQLQQYKEDDFELNGWLSRVADTYMSSSQWYIDKIQPLLEYHAKPILRLEKDLRHELSRIYYQETVDEFMFTYMAEDIAWVQRKIDSADRISKLSHFPKRPFVVSKSHEEL